MFLKSLIWLFAWLTSAAAETLVAKAGCQDTCGNISIPYPFGVGEPHCYQQSGLKLVCNASFNPPKLLYANIPLVSISLLNRTMTVGLGVSYYCYDQAGELSDWQTWTFTLNENYYFSDTRNKFTAIGCDTDVVMSDISEAIFKSGCMSVCTNKRSVVEESCSGIGCCQIAILKGLKALNGLADSILLSQELTGNAPDKGVQGVSTYSYIGSTAIDDLRAVLLGLTMKEAAAELEGLRRFEMHPWALQRNEENMSLLSEPQDIYSIELSSYTGDASGQYSMEVMPMNVPPR
ncbi:hypothetical protein GIB67_033798 [Kingdonia uniflora]|uniref:Wall-associated receptor kinase galacturonan-binding domain-containing protein n=1 Tax=Kingdonia uniflora TaxID=39325 RepID=A0A7J7P490_9MAGN|nr:hypothetical protein GIB67_033798 [Kingdonia uniflora]